MKDIDLRKLCYCLFIAAEELDTDASRTVYKARYSKTKHSLTWAFPNGVTLRLETPAALATIPLLLHTAAQESGKALAKDFLFDFEVAQGGTDSPCRVNPNEDSS